MSVTLHPLWSTVQGLYEIHQWRNPHPILHMVHYQEWGELLQTLADFRLCKSEIEVGGGNFSPIAARLHNPLKSLGWKEEKFETRFTVNGQPRDSRTHKVDCMKSRVAVEVEWNNKDPFFDRDLDTFRLLYDLRVIDVGVIITRCDELQNIFKTLVKTTVNRKTGEVTTKPASISYGMNTTHMGQLLKRIEGGGGGGCPIMAFGISEKLYDPHC